MKVEYDNSDDTFNPAQDWFSFSPRSFSLEPGEKQEIEISVEVPPAGVFDGEYFAFLVAQPQQNSQSVGIAAGTKLYFSVENSNILLAIFTDITSLISKYKLLSIILSTLIVLILLLYLFKKFFKVRWVKEEEIKEK